MKKLILFLLLTLPLSSKAQQMSKLEERRNYGKFDFEIGMTMPFAASLPDNYKYNQFWPYFYIEGRWQLNEEPISVGFNLGSSMVRRTDYYNNIDNWTTTTLMVVGDYQWGRGKKVNPFAGLGIGLAANDLIYMGESHKPFCISPRVGVRLMKFSTVSVGYLYTLQSDNSRMYINMGFYF